MSDMLFSRFTLGPIELANRIVMAPMTRNRSPANVPAPYVADYYAQRAEAGLIVTEGTSPSADGVGYARMPGLFNDLHKRAWSTIASAVHAKGGRIFVQLMHTGRASAQANLPEGARVLAPSAIVLTTPVWVDGQGRVPATVPTEMTDADVERTIEAFARSATLAIEAGCDGVELHGANGYLLDQFLNAASNRRTDRWGGSVENRIRFAVEVAKRTAARIGAGRVGMRVAPFGVFNDMTPDAQTPELFETLARELSQLGLAYLHIVDHSAMGAPPIGDAIKRSLRAAFKGAFILSGGYDRARAEADLASGHADLIAFGRPFISNPRLPTKLRANAPLAPYDFATFYTPGEKGYTDYPTD